MSHIPTLDLADGATIPAIGFGPYPVTGEEGTAAIATAIDAGYRPLEPPSTTATRWRSARRSAGRASTVTSSSCRGRSPPRPRLRRRGGLGR
ncbi:MAG: hypothetical protein ABI336_02250 [Humibacillus sp.]